jgi:hypothetical protein
MKRTLLAAAGFGVVVGVLIAVMLARSSHSSLQASHSVTHGGTEAQAPSQRSGVAPPVFSTAASSIERRPGARSYDPNKFLASMSAAQVFAQEPRDPDWAPRMEAGLRSALDHDLRPIIGDKSVPIECRTSACRFAWDGLDAGERLKAQRLLAALWGGSGGGGNPREMVAFYTGGSLGVEDGRDPEALMKRLASLRESRLRSMRERLSKAPMSVGTLSPSDLPAE